MIRQLGEGREQAPVPLPGFYAKVAAGIHEQQNARVLGLLSPGVSFFRRVAFASLLLLAGLGVAYGLDLWAGHSTPVLFLLALGGSFVSFIYSAPPLKLKQNGWLGNYALGASYIALPWWAGQALFGQLTWTTALLTLAYSLAGLGIAVVNDFKSVEGDRALGLQSLPVAFGIEKASWISAGMIDVFQLAMVAVLIAIGQHFAAVLLVLLIIPQITFQDIWLLRDPVAFDVKYQASAQPFLVLGMLVTALAIGHSPLVVM